MEKWTRVKYQPNLPLTPRNYVTCSEKHIHLSLNAAQEGMVLLKNDSKLLPLSADCKVCLFGKGTFDYVKGGGRSGDVHTKYICNLYEGIKTASGVEVFEPLAQFYSENVQRQYRCGAAPGMTVEPELPEPLADEARSFSDTAIISISRFSGEGWDRSSVEFIGEYNPWPDEGSMPKTAGKIFPDGDFYLTAEEKNMISRVTTLFPKVVVVLNVGGIVDTSWIRDSEKISSALLAWQGGMEGGLAATNILFGKITPSGKLPDTFASHVEDYPSTEHFHDDPYYVDYTEDIYVGYRHFETIPGMRQKVVYPFGYGFSYTEFRLEPGHAWEDETGIHIQVTATNTGKYSGEEVVQIYASAPQGKLGKATLTLAAFQKTKLLTPGESQTEHCALTATPLHPLMIPVWCARQLTFWKKVPITFLWVPALLMQIGWPTHSYWMRILFFSSCRAN